MAIMGAGRIIRILLDMEENYGDLSSLSTEQRNFLFNTCSKMQPVNCDSYSDCKKSDEQNKWVWDGEKWNRAIGLERKIIPGEVIQ